jgi:hypothetical protein
VYPIITSRVVEAGGRFVEVTGRWFTRNATVTIDYVIEEDGTSPIQIGQDVITSDARGRFVHAIPVSFSGDFKGIVLQATDLASGATGNVSDFF